MELYFRMPLLSIGNLLWGCSKIGHDQSEIRLPLEARVILSIGNFLRVAGAMPKRARLRVFTWESTALRSCVSAMVGNGLTVTRTEISTALGVAAVLALDGGALIGRALGRRLVGLLIVCGCILAVRTLAVGLAGSTAACPTAEAAVGEVVAALALDGNVLGGRALI